MVHPDRRKPERVVESPTRVVERNLWQPPRAGSEPDPSEPGTSVADQRRVPLPALPDAARHTGSSR